MGSLRRLNGLLNLTDVVRTHSLTQFVETGTYQGDSVYTALEMGFKGIFTVEILLELADAARMRFKHYDNVAILNGSSELMLPAIIKQLKGNTLWWLDAHLHNTYSGTPAESYSNLFPLHIELTQMLKHRDCSHDVILVDDLRIYEDGPFPHGNAPAHHACSKDGIGFVEKLLGKTHRVEKLFADEGYIVCMPTL